MSVVEIREQIKKELDKMPEDTLKDLLGLINKMQEKKYIDDETLDKHMDAIISENRELLQRLAQ